MVNNLHGYASKAPNYTHSGIEVEAAFNAPAAGPTSEKVREKK